jgi:hypothetical protein
MFTSTACRFVVFYFLSLSANADEGGLRVLGQSDDAHRMLDVTPTPIHEADLGGLFLEPGTYDAAATLGLTGTVTLVGASPYRDPTCTSEPICYEDSDADDKWTIHIGGTFITNAKSKMVIKGVAGRSSNVRWEVDGAITLGTNSVAVGSMKTNAAMTVGAGDSENPSFAFGTDETFTFTISGALTMSAGSFMTIAAGAKVNWVVTGAITLGAGSIAVGDMESTFGAITLGALASSGNLKASGGLTVGAEATTGTLQAGGAITLGANVNGGNPPQILDYNDCTEQSVFVCPP